MSEDDRMDAASAAATGAGDDDTGAADAMDTEPVHSTQPLRTLRVDGDESDGDRDGAGGGAGDHRERTAPPRAPAYARKKMRIDPVDDDDDGGGGGGGADKFEHRSLPSERKSRDVPARSRRDPPHMSAKSTTRPHTFAAEIDRIVSEEKTPNGGGDGEGGGSGAGLSKAEAYFRRNAARDFMKHAETLKDTAARFASVRDVIAGTDDDDMIEDIDATAQKIRELQDVMDSVKTEAERADMALDLEDKVRSATRAANSFIRIAERLRAAETGAKSYEDRIARIEDEARRLQDTLASANSRMFVEESMPSVFAAARSGKSIPSASSTESGSARVTRAYRTDTTKMDSGRRERSDPRAAVAAYDMDRRRQPALYDDGGDDHDEDDDGVYFRREPRHDVKRRAVPPDRSLVGQFVVDMAKKMALEDADEPKRATVHVPLPSDDMTRMLQNDSTQPTVFPGMKQIYERAFNDVVRGDGSSGAISVFSEDTARDLADQMYRAFQHMSTV